MIDVQNWRSQCNYNAIGVREIILKRSKYDQRSMETVGIVWVGLHVVDLTFFLLLLIIIFLLLLFLSAVLSVLLFFLLSGIAFNKWYGWGIYKNTIQKHFKTKWNLRFSILIIINKKIEQLTSIPCGIKLLDWELKSYNMFLYYIIENKRIANKENRKRGLFTVLVCYVIWKDDKYLN